MKHTTRQSKYYDLQGNFVGPADIIEKDDMEFVNDPISGWCLLRYDYMENLDVHCTLDDLMKTKLWLESLK